MGIRGPWLSVRAVKWHRYAPNKSSPRIRSAIKNPTRSIWWEEHPRLSLCLFPSLSSLSLLQSNSISFHPCRYPSPSVSLNLRLFFPYSQSRPPVSCLSSTRLYSTPSLAQTLVDTHSCSLWIFHAAETAGSKTELSSSGLRANIYFLGWVQEGRGPAEIR